MKGIRIHHYGNSDVLGLEELPDAPPGPGQALVKLKACGVNFIDIYQRRGIYPVPLPCILGLEGSGVVEQVGEKTTMVKVGDRVAFAGIPGAYATHLGVPADRLVLLPDSLAFEQGAAAMLQGMTAHYLSHSTYPIKPGESCLVHAAAGGVGQLLCQMAKMRGAKVFATVSSTDKAKLAKEAGADEVIRYDEKEFDAEVKRLTGGKGVNVVYDGVGKSTYEKSLNSLAVRGMLVLFGQSSGPVPSFDAQILNTKGSLFLTRPSLGHYTATRDELVWRSADVLNWISSGKLKLRIDRTFPLSQAREAHQVLENRETSGKVLLLP